MGILTLAMMALSVVGGQPEPGFKCVGNNYFNGNLSGSCVAVSPRWIIGVRHASGQRSEIDGKSYTVIREVRNPNNADLVLLKVKETIPTFAYLGFIEFEDLKGKKVKIVGCGRSGGRVTEGFSTQPGTEGGRQSAMNTIDAIQETKLNWGTPADPKVFTSQVLMYDIDGEGMPERNVMGSAKPVNGEGGHADKDSGGGWFVNTGKDWKLVALCAYVNTAKANAKYGYGSVGSAVYLNPHKDWITKTISE
jgi:hypothetical protein